MKDVREISERVTCDSLDEYIGSLSPNDPRRIKAPANDPVNHPSHYNTGNIEVIEFIEDKHMGFHLGNAIKYISRAGKKNPEKTVEDLKKAIWYIERHIEINDRTRKPRRPNEMKER